MKATARLITGVIGARASQIGSVRAKAFGLPAGLSVSARQTEESGIMHYLHVKPVEPQQLVWLVPQYGIDYHIESNTNWNIK